MEREIATNSNQINVAEAVPVSIEKFCQSRSTSMLVLTPSLFPMVVHFSWRSPVAGGSSHRRKERRHLPSRCSPCTASGEFKARPPKGVYLPSLKHLSLAPVAS